MSKIHLELRPPPLHSRIVLDGEPLGRVASAELAVNPHTAPALHLHCLDDNLEPFTRSFTLEPADLELSALVEAVNP